MKNYHFYPDFTFLSGLMNSCVVFFLYFNTWNQVVFCKQGCSYASLFILFHSKCPYRFISFVSVIPNVHTEISLLWCCRNEGAPSPTTSGTFLVDDGPYYFCMLEILLGKLSRPLYKQVLVS